MSLLKYILKEHSLSVNSILDKINKNGIESLSDIEQRFLKHNNKENFIDDILSSEFESVEDVDIKRKSFNKIKEMTVFMNRDGEVIYEYDPKNNVFYISDDNILFEFFKDEEQEVITFIENKYNISINKIERIFTNK